MLPTLRRLVCAAGLLAAVSSPVWADIRYVTETTMEMEGSTQTLTTVTTEVKGKRERVEMKMSMGPMQMQRVTLTMCDTGQRVEINDAAKVYCVSSIRPLHEMSGQTPQGPRRAARKPGTGQVVATVSVKDLGSEKIGQFDTHHYAINMAMQQAGCAGSDASSFDSEMWVAPGMPIFFCAETNKDNLTVDEDGCKITYITKGDMAKFAAIQSGLVVQRKFSQAGTGPMMQRVTSYDGKATLSDADFQIPAGYTKVSQTEFEQAVMRAMMQNMQNMQMPAPDKDE